MIKKFIILIFILMLGVIVLFSCSASENSNTEVSDITESISVHTELPQELSEYLIGSQSLDVIYKTIPNISGVNIDLKMDIYYPKTEKYDKSPVVVCFHGGGWVAGDKSQIIYIFAPVVEKLRENGYTVVTVQYRFADGTAYFPAQIEDCIDSILYIKNNANKYNIDTDSIGVLGYSAGAQLAMLSAYAKEEFSATSETVDIKYCVSFAGPTKMYDDDVKKYPYDIIYLLENLFDGTYEEKEEVYKKGSPYYYLDRADTNGNNLKKVPLLLVQDELDNVVPFEQTEIMFEKAVESGILCELLKLNGVGHQIDFTSGYMTSPSSSEATDDVVNFICKYSGK